MSRAWSGSTCVCCGAKTARCESNVRRTTPGSHSWMDLLRDKLNCGLDVAFRIGSATIRCSVRADRERVVVSGNAWATRCPKCHNHLSERPKAAYKCPSCGAGLYFFTSTSGSKGFFRNGSVPTQCEHLWPRGKWSRPAGSEYGNRFCGSTEADQVSARQRAIRVGAGAAQVARHPNVVRLQASG